MNVGIHPPTRAGSRTAASSGAGARVCLAALVCLAGLVGCTRDPAPVPVLHSVVPSQGPTGVPVAVTVRGAHLLPSLHLDLDASGTDAAAHGGFRLDLGATSLENIRWVDGETLTAVVPATVPLGVHDLQLVSPDGRIIRLLDAYEALDSLPPAVTFLSPVPPEAAAPGTDLMVEVSAEDDGGVAFIDLEGCLVPEPAAGDCELEVLDRWTVSEEPATRVTAEFSFAVPESAPEGAEVRLRAVSEDLRGNAAEARTVAVVRRAPVILSIDPGEGTEAGGDVVEVQGADFDGATRFLVGDALATAAVIDATTAVVITPPGIGTVDFVARRGSADAVLVDAFTYRPGPRLDSVEPPMISATGGNVALSGAHLVPETRVHLSGVPVQITWASPERVHLRLPGAEPGDRVLTLQTRFGEAQITVSLSASPILDSLDPARVSVEGGARVTVHGAGFIDDPSLEIRVDGVAAEAALFESPQRLSFTAPPGSGEVEVQVFSDAHPPSSVLLLTYADPPQADAIVPTRGPLEGGAEIVIGGTGFLEPADVTFDGVSAPSLTLDGADLRVVTPPGLVPGPVDVVVITDVGASEPLTYTYLAPPDVSLVVPGAGPANEQTPVVIEGTGFLDEPETEVWFGEDEAVVQSITAERIEALTPALPTGTVAVEVRHPLQSEGLAGSFSYSDLIITDVDPADGPESGGNVVLVAGRGFEADPTVTFGEVDATEVVRVSDELLEVTVPAGSPGDVDVTLALPGGDATVLVEGYRYNPTPCLEEVRPGGGPLEGGNLVTLVGCDFLDADDLAVSFGGVAATSVEWIGPDEIRAVVPAGAGAGLVVVTVTSSRHDPATLDEAYRYGLGLATIVAPASGDTVAPGEALSVVVVVDGGGEAISEVFMRGTFSGGGTDEQSIVLDPGEMDAFQIFDLPIPADAAEGSSVSIEAWATLADETSLIADPVTVDVTAFPGVVDFWFEPAALEITVGETQLLRIFARFTDGVVREVGTERVAVLEMDGDAAAVSAQGVVRGESVGEATVIAILDDGRRIEAPVTVVLERVFLDRTRLLMATGQSTQLRLTRVEGATVEDLTADAIWQVDPVGIVGVDAGLADALAVGLTSVTATHGTLEASAAVRVGDADEDVVLEDGAPWWAEGPALAFRGLAVPAGATLVGTGLSCLGVNLGEGGLNVEEGGRIDVSGRPGMPGAMNAPRPPDLRRGGDGGPGAGGGGGGSVGGEGGDGNPPGEDTIGNSDDGGVGGGPGGGLGGVDAHSTARAGSAGGGGGYGGIGGTGGRVQFGSGAGGAGGPVNDGTAALGGSGGGGGDGGSVTGPHGTAGGGGGGGGCLDVQVVGGEIRIRGEVLAQGGAGGGAIHESKGGGAGGGSGGAIWLVTDGLMSLGGMVSVAGGPGGSSEMEGSGQPGAGGGGGGGGWLRLAADRLEYGAVRLEVRGGPGGRVPEGPDPGEPGEPGVLELSE